MFRKESNKSKYRSCRSQEQIKTQECLLPFTSESFNCSCPIEKPKLEEKYDPYLRLLFFIDVKLGLTLREDRFETPVRKTMRELEATGE
jgi:hypothetical protein